MENELNELYYSQLEDFELARKNFANLKNVVYRHIPFDGFRITLQFNPDRILSTTAKIDPATLKQRKCFLCPEYLPTGQKGISYNERYNLFVNPYPIFEKHFTVPAKTHSPQLIEGRLDDMLDLTRDLPSSTLFYNGPKSGASAPDHFHFQAAQRGVMPLEEDVKNRNIAIDLVKNTQYTISTIRQYLRKVVVIRSADREILSRLFQQTLDLIGQHIPFEQEPGVNLLTWCEDGVWTVCLLPRKALRPWQFFTEGDEQILFSPGCVDMAGLVIVPRKEDFDKYTPALLTDLFDQVTPDDSTWELICRKMVALNQQDKKNNR